MALCPGSEIKPKMVEAKAEAVMMSSMCIGTDNMSDYDSDSDEEKDKFDRVGLVTESKASLVDAAIVDVNEGT